MTSNCGGFSSPVVALFATQLCRELDAEERECLEQLSAKGMAKLNRDQCAGIALECTLLELKIAFRRLKQRCFSLAESGFQTQSLSSSPTTLGFFRRKFSHYSSHSLTPADVAGLREAMTFNKRRYWPNNEDDFSEDDLVDMALDLRDKDLWSQAKHAARALSTPVSISHLAPTTISTVPTDEQRTLPATSVASPSWVELSKFTFPEGCPQPNEASPPSPSHSRVYQVLDIPGCRHRRITEDPSEAWFEVSSPRDTEQCVNNEERTSEKDLSPPQSPLAKGSKRTRSILKSQCNEQGPSSPQNLRPRGSLARFGTISVHEIPAPSASLPPLPALGDGSPPRAIRPVLKRKGGNQKGKEPRETTQNDNRKVDGPGYEEVKNALGSENGSNLKLEPSVKNVCNPSVIFPSRSARGLAFLKAKLFSFS